MMKGTKVLNEELLFPHMRKNLSILPSPSSWALILIRDVTTGATVVAPKFSDTYLNQGGQILPTIAEVAANIFP